MFIKVSYAVLCGFYPISIHFLCRFYLLSMRFLYGLSHMPRIIAPHFPERTRDAGVFSARNIKNHPRGLPLPMHPDVFSFASFAPLRETLAIPPPKARGQGNEKCLSADKTRQIPTRGPLRRGHAPFSLSLARRACMCGVRAFFSSLTRRVGSSEARRTGLNFPQSSRFTITLPKARTRFKQTDGLFRLTVKGRTVFFRGKL